MKVVGLRTLAQKTWGKFMICPNKLCGHEMIQIPSTIQIDKHVIGDPNSKIYKCPKCLRICAETIK